MNDVTRLQPGRRVILTPASAVTVRPRPQQSKGPQVDYLQQLPAMPGLEGPRPVHVVNGHEPWCRARMSHRSVRALAKCMWPEFAAVRGSGPWAALSFCRDGVAVLCKDEEAARQILAGRDKGGCGGKCQRDPALHLLVYVNASVYRHGERAA